MLILAGAGGHGAEVAAYLSDPESTRLPRLDVVFDEGPPRLGFPGARRIGNLAALADILAEPAEEPPLYITAVGDNRLRRDLVGRLETLSGTGLEAWTCRHPRAWTGEAVDVHPGSLLAPGSVVTTRTSIGRHCILNVKASVSHDCRVGDFCNVNPGATICGNVTVGEGAYIGAGATVIDNLAIGRWAVIGAGAVVVTDIPDYALAVGVPARVVRDLRESRV